MFSAIVVSYASTSSVLGSVTHMPERADVLVHKTHRHEPPVQGEIELVGETPDYVVVSKPSSMTMHPCGAYYHNSLMHILRYEPIVVNQPNLLLVHRLDR